MRRQRQRSRCSPRQGPSLVFHQQAEVAFSQLPLGGTSRRVQKYPAFRHIMAQLVSQTGKDSAEILPGSLLGLGRCESRHGPGPERFSWVADLNRGLTSRAGARRAVLLAASQLPGRGGEAIRGEKIASGAPSPWQPRSSTSKFSPVHGEDASPPCAPGGLRQKEPHLGCFVAAGEGLARGRNLWH